MATIRGKKLQEYLIEEFAIPPKVASEVDRVSGKLSNAFCTWEQQDQLLFSWLLSSMFDSMLIMMIGWKWACLSS